MIEKNKKYAVFSKSFEDNGIMIKVSCINGEYFIDNNGTIESITLFKNHSLLNVPCK